MPPARLEPTQGALILAEKLGKDSDRPDGGALAHAGRVLRLGAVFAAGKPSLTNSAMADLLVLHDVPGRVINRKYQDEAKRVTDRNYDNYRKDMHEGLRDYLDSLKTEPGGVSADMMVGMLFDQVKLGEEAKEHRRRALQVYMEQNGGGNGEVFGFDQQPQGGELLTHGDELDAINKHHLRAMSPQYAGLTAPRILYDKKSQLAHETHGMAVFAKGVETLDKLKNPKTIRDDAALLHDILEAESLYRPMLEAYGFHALAAEIDSICKIHRVEMQGESQLVEEAAEMYRKYSKIDPGVVIQRMFGLSEPPEVKWIVNETDAVDIKKGVNCRFAEMNVVLPSGKTCRIKFRQKSIGSMADKLLGKKKSAEKKRAEGKEGDSGYEMMDVLGFTLIVGDEAHQEDAYDGMTDHELAEAAIAQTQELKDSFEAIVQTVLEDDGIRLSSPEPSKRPVHIQGTHTFTEGVGARGIQQRFGDDIVGVRSYDDTRLVYQVAKVTGFMDNVPFELQCVGHHDHEQSRTGPLSHDAYEAVKRLDKETYRDDTAIRAEIARALTAINKARHDFGNPNRISCLAGQLALLQLQAGLLPDDASPK